MVWCPDQPWGDNLCYVAFDGSDYTVAIRGSVVSFSWIAFNNWIQEDFNVFEQAAWPYVSDSAAMIAQGTFDAMNLLTNLVDSSSGTPVTLWEFMDGANSPSQTGVWVTGHSLGGGLATVLATYLYTNFVNKYGSAPPMSVATFAAPAAGNQAFADCYDAMFGANASRYYITGDIVPCFPAVSSVIGMSDWYSPDPSASAIDLYHGFTLRDAFWGLAMSIGASEYENGSYYCQVNQTQGSIPLTTSTCGQWTSNTITDWFETAACNHEKCTYLPAMGVGTFKCTPSSSADCP